MYLMALTATLVSFAFTILLDEKHSLPDFEASHDFRGARAEVYFYKQCSKAP